jgi:hypothetical protein
VDFYPLRLFYLYFKEDKTMTRTVQPHTWTVVHKTVAKKTEKTKLTEAEKNICDILSVCDSLNKLHETLNRLAYVLQRKNIETSLSGNGEKCR